MYYETSKIYTAAKLVAENPQDWDDATLAKHCSVSVKKLKEWQQTSIWMSVISQHTEKKEETESTSINYSSKVEDYQHLLNNCTNIFLSCLEISLKRLYSLNQKVSTADLTLKEEMEAQKRLDLSLKTLANASMFMVELKDIELQVNELSSKLKEINNV